MRWTERQEAMLGEMGIRLFQADPHLRDRTAIPDGLRAVIEPRAVLREPVDVRGLDV